MFFGELVCGLIWSEWDMWDMWPSLFLMGLLTTFRSVRHGTDFLEFPAMRLTEMRCLNSKTPAVSSAISVSGNSMISLLHVESTFWEFDLRNDLTSRHSDPRGSTPLLPWRPHRAWRKHEVHEAQDPHCMTEKRRTQKMLKKLMNWPMNEKWILSIFLYISYIFSPFFHCSEKGASLPPRWIVSVHLEIDPARESRRKKNRWNLT